MLRSSLETIPFWSQCDHCYTNPSLYRFGAKTDDQPKGELKTLCYAKPVTIGNNVWLAANVTVCGGVTIGDGCVIGAGSVVTRDIPANSFAAGVPCKVIRPITDDDSMRFKPEILADCRIEE